MLNARLATRHRAAFTRSHTYTRTYSHAFEGLVFEIVRLVFWGRVKTAIYEASDTKNVSLTHEKYRYDTAVNCRYKTIFFWCDKTQSILQC